MRDIPFSWSFPWSQDCICLAFDEIFHLLICAAIPRSVLVHILQGPPFWRPLAYQRNTRRCCLFLFKYISFFNRWKWKGLYMYNCFSPTQFAGMAPAYWPQPMDVPESKWTNTSAMRSPQHSSFSHASMGFVYGGLCGQNVWWVAIASSYYVSPSPLSFARVCSKPAYECNALVQL